MAFEFINSGLDGVMLVKPEIFSDERGVFSEVYKSSGFKSAGIPADFVQDNCSVSKYGVLRGIHFQKTPYAQAKLVRCVYGKIYDVAVDLRPASKTFKKFIRVELSEENGNALFIPKGFGHGFVALSKEAVVVYKTDCEYNSDADCGIFWADKDLDIDWGIDFEPVLSDKDLALPRLEEVLV